MTYFDYCASAPLKSGVIKFVKNDFCKKYANPSSTHDLGYALQIEIKLLRQKISDKIGTNPFNLIFTSGATESVNSILNFENIKHMQVKSIISSKMEHSSTIENLSKLNSHVPIHYIKTKLNGELELNSLQEILIKNPKSLVTITYVNNETGIINNTKRIVSLCKEFDAKIHLDCSQMLGKISINLSDIGADFASFSGHKIGALKGIGMMFIKDLNYLHPMIRGGGQEMGLRAGTTNYHGIKSIDLALEECCLNHINSIEKYRDSFEKNLKKHIPEAHIFGQSSKRLTGVCSFSLPGIPNERSMLKLSEHQIYVGSGSACNSGTQKGSHVIQEISQDLRLSRSFIRMSSFGEEWKNLDIGLTVSYLKQLMH